MGLQYQLNSSTINMPPITDDEVITQEEVGDNSRGNRGNNGGNKRRGQRINFAFQCDPHQRVKSKTSWCSYLLYNRKISEYLKIKIEKAQIHSILKNLLPSTIFKNVQMTIPPCLLDQ